MRLRYDANAEEKLENSGFIVSAFPLKVDKKTVIELGMGKGEMITQLASENPNINYIGIEKFATVAAKAARRASELKLKNFKIILADINVINELISGQVETMWLTFSDPWPKNRHEKRRLTFKSFLEMYKKIISKDGFLKMKTDNDKLFEYTLESINDFGMNIIEQTKDFHYSPFSKGNKMTGYEKKWSSQGKNINYLKAQF